MMEVTAHLKSVLKNYQHSAIKSLQGPGKGDIVVDGGGGLLDYYSHHHHHGRSRVVGPASAVNGTVLPANGAPGGGGGTGTNGSNMAASSMVEEEFVPPPPSVVQQLPILAAADTSGSDLTETFLESEAISCFVVGGEKRLCLPQVLNSVLRDFALHQINQECDQLQIYCSRCTPEQLTVLKNQGILPASAASSGLITKTDAERLCSALLHQQQLQQSLGAGIGPLLAQRHLAGNRKAALCFSVVHKCFGKSRGTCYPDLFTSKQAVCIECADCLAAFTPQQFVCHVHRHRSENRTVHWGFDSANWPVYLRICKRQTDRDHYAKYLSDMKDQYDGKLPHPLVPPTHNAASNAITSSASSSGSAAVGASVLQMGVKRKQILASDIIKEQQQQQQQQQQQDMLPLKKQKLLGAMSVGADPPLVSLNHLPYNMQQIQQIYATLDPLYLQNYIQECHASVVSRHLSAFKPVNTSNTPNHHHPHHHPHHPHHHHHYPHHVPAPPPPSHSHHHSHHHYSNPQTHRNRYSTPIPEPPDRPYQPNVSLASPPPPPLPPPPPPLPPPQTIVTPKKHHRYGKSHAINCSLQLSNAVSIKEEIDEERKPPPLAAPAAVSVVVVATPPQQQQLPQYNSEIELSTTDTEDSTSEVTVKSEPKPPPPPLITTCDQQVEAVIGEVNNGGVRDRLHALFRHLYKQLCYKDDRIEELEARVKQLEAVAPTNDTSCDNSGGEKNHQQSTALQNGGGDGGGGAAGGICSSENSSGQSSPFAATPNNNNDDDQCSSNVAVVNNNNNSKLKCDLSNSEEQEHQQQQQQTSVIASLPEQKAVVLKPITFPSSSNSSSTSSSSTV